jgi:ATP-dependent Lon protease
MKSPFQHPALVALMFARWDDAFGWLHPQSEKLLGDARSQALLDALGNASDIRDAINDTVDALYAHGKIASGEYALAWSMLTCSPRRPASFRAVLPQLQFALDEAALADIDDADVRDRIRVWWRAAEGEFTGSKRSMFALADAVLNETYEPEPEIEKPTTKTVSWFSAPYAGPTLTVMPAAKASKLNNHNAPFKDILDKPLPLVLARNLDAARRKLGYEFPHAENALNSLFRDLREGQPVKIRPTLLVGMPGVSKSRIVRKFAAAIGIQHVQRVDGSSSGDNHFGGTSKAWSNTEASVPARACLQSRTANPLVFVDEVDKAGISHHGNLFHAMLPFLETETAARYRDQSLDAELDLSAVSYIATANDASVLPDFLRDRFRIIRIPAPRLVDLPLLAASIMADLSKEEEERAWDGPLASDELMVIAKAWERAGFSLRKLQKIVRATLEARDQFAMRH